jgi:Zn-dependent protease with chaperone function
VVQVYGLLFPPKEQANMQSAIDRPEQAEEDQRECPQCGTTIPVYAGYVTWCHECGWNLQPHDPEPPRNLFEAFYASLGRRLGQRLFDELIRTSALKPTLTPAKVAAFGIALLVHGITFGLAILGVLLIVGSGFHIMFVIYGLILLGIAWVLRPRVPKLDKSEEDEIVSREDFPTLYKVVDDVARSLNTSSVSAIIVDDQFNAAFAQVGWRRRKVLYLGLPLLTVLDPQERVAVIGHELAHGVNGDQTRGFFVGSALWSLVEWHNILTPDSNDDPGIPVITFFTNIIMVTLGTFAKLWVSALAHLLWRDSQRAEYLADALAARLGGTEAQLSSLEKLHFARIFDLLAEKAAINSAKQDLFSELRSRIAIVPRRELQRISRVERLRESRLDATHPPTPFRIDFLRAHPVTQPQVVMSQADFEQMEHELASLHGPIQEQILDKYRDRLYY